MPLAAQSENPVGLGISLGAAVAEGSTPNIPNSGGSMSFNWGFYVDIPLLYTFHITPSSELYKLQDQNATDIDLAFKFIVPLSTLAVYAGWFRGSTAVTNVLDPHVGVLGGATFQLVSNLDVFLQGKVQHRFRRRAEPPGDPRERGDPFQILMASRSSMSHSSDSHTAWKDS